VLVELEDLAVVGSLALEHAACIVHRVGQDMDVGLAPRDQLAIEPDPPVAIIESALLGHPKSLLRIGA
jgi:hypothetical protein